MIETKFTSKEDMEKWHEAEKERKRIEEMQLLVDAKVGGFARILRSSGLVNIKDIDELLKFHMRELKAEGRELFMIQVQPILKDFTRNYFVTSKKHESKSSRNFF